MQPLPRIARRPRTGSRSLQGRQNPGVTRESRAATISTAQVHGAAPLSPPTRAHWSPPSAHLFDREDQELGIPSVVGRAATRARDPLFLLRMPVYDKSSGRTGLFFPRAPWLRLVCDAIDHTHCAPKTTAGGGTGSVAPGPARVECCGDTPSSRVERACAGVSRGCFGKRPSPEGGRLSGSPAPLSRGHPSPVSSFEAGLQRPNPLLRREACFDRIALVPSPI